MCSLFRDCTVHLRVCSGLRSIFSALGDISLLGVYHQCIDIPRMHWWYSSHKSWYSPIHWITNPKAKLDIPPCADDIPQCTDNIPQCTDNIPPMHWTPLSALMVSLQCTEHPQWSTDKSPLSALMVSLQCTEHPQWSTDKLYSVIRKRNFHIWKGATTVRFFILFNKFFNYILLKNTVFWLVN